MFIVVLWSVISNQRSSYALALPKWNQSLSINSISLATNWFANDPFLIITPFTYPLNSSNEHSLVKHNNRANAKGWSCHLILSTWYYLYTSFSETYLTLYTLTFNYSNFSLLHTVPSQVVICSFCWSRLVTW